MQAYAAPTLLTDDAIFAAALESLAVRDGALMVALDAVCERPRRRNRDPGFEGLAQIIVAQQVSTASADAIFGRLKTRVGSIEAPALADVSDEDLRLCGLSAAKARTLRAIAAAVANGSLDFAALGAMEAEAAHASLCAIKGIGPWTADVFLLFGLGHADAWPAGDLALQEAAKLVLGLATRPTTDELRVLGERWRPLRGVAAHCLWAYYRAARMRPTTFDAPSEPEIPAPSTVRARIKRTPGETS